MHTFFKILSLMNRRHQIYSHNCDELLEWLLSMKDLTKEFANFCVNPLSLIDF